MKAKDFIRENIRGVVEQFKTDHAEDIEYGCTRNHCKVPAIAFVKYAKQKGYDVELVRGDFVVDNPEYHFDDLKPEEKSTMKMQYMDPRKPEDVEKFAKRYNKVEEFKRIPHYWNEYKGQIIDFTGQAQFVDTGLAADTDNSRYEK